MPVQFEIDKSKRLVMSTASYELTLNDVRKHQDALLAHPDFNHEFDQIGIFTDTVSLDMSAAEVREAATRQLFASTSRRAFVASTSHTFGMARMFETYYSMLEHPAQTHVFHNLEAALEWLGRK